MIRTFTLLFLTVFATLVARAGYTPVTVTGFTKDVVANGTGSALSSTTDSVDAAGFAFVAPDFKANAGDAAPTYSLPANGFISTIATGTPGLTFQLASYTGNNSLKLAAINASGTLTFGTPRNASEVFVLATSGSGAATGTTFLVTFSDGTTQSFTQTVPDWYDATTTYTPAIQGLGRVRIITNVLEGTATGGPKLFQIRLGIDAGNYSKPIASITITKTNATGTGYINVMAVSVNTVSPCGPPTNQPTNLQLTPTVYGVTGSFTASVPPANKYMVLRALTSAGGPDTPPADGTTYTAGQTLGNATIVSVSASTTFNDPGLTIGTSYTYAVLGYSDSTCYGISPAYNQVNPLIGSATIPSCSATPGGTYTVGPTGTYPNLSAAMTALNNAAGASGNVIVELQPAYTSNNETFPINIPNISTSPCAVNNPTLTIRPAAGATGLTITGKINMPLLDFNGARRVTLDGRPGGTGTTSQLTINNDSTAGVAIRIANDASFNTITYCDIQGRNTNNTSSTLSGVVYFGQANTTTLAGNDYNTISYSSIHGNANGTPAIGISAYGTTTRKVNYNDSCIINNCNIYDFFNAGTASTGIKLDVGNNAWTINANNLYQTAARTYTAAATHRGLWITPNVASNDSTAGGFVITNNVVGGSAPAAGSTAYTMTGTLANVFLGMDLSLGNGVASSVQSNRVANIALTSGSTTTGVFAGINIANGNVNVGTLTGNMIGSATVPGSISITSASGGTSYGIRVASGATVNISKDTITGITGSGTTAAISTNFTGIVVSGGTTVNISNNLIGSATVSNSINLTSTGSTTAQSLNGISVTAGSTVNLLNNTIANLTNGYTSTGAGITRGINVSSSTVTISGNTIRNLSSSTLSTSTGGSAALQGIAMSSTSSAAIITGNTISSLISMGATTSAAINLTGIYFSGTTSATSYVVKNNIHSFDAPADTNVVFTGIDYATGTAVVANNFIRMGIKPDGTSFTTGAVNRGISSNSSTAANNFYYNSIYIGGTGVGTSTTPKNSYAFIRTSISGTYDIRNNVFVNSRSNATTGGKHYAIYFTTATTGAAPNYNVYNAAGTGGVFAYNGTADVATYTSGWVAGDANSAYGDPGFANATGTSATFDLHIPNGTSSIAESAATPVAFVTDDYDGQNRSATIPDAGADEFNGVNPNTCTGTPVAGTVNASVTQTCVGSTVTLSVTGSTSAPGISFQWQSSSDSTNWTDVSGANSSSLTVTFTSRIYYRVRVICSSGSSANSAGISINTYSPTYAVYNGASYTESFENWINACNTTDLPSVNWRAAPSTGDSSWRRNDQGASAGWVNVTSGAFSPTFTVGSYSARFHSYQAAAGTKGYMDFYVNMSAAGASTNLKFDYINTSGNDSMVVYLSTNGGTSFTRLDSIRTRAAWTNKTILLTTNSATTVIRFLATSDFGNTDIGMDNLQLVNFSQCTGTPNAGVVYSSANPVCAGISFTLADTLATQLSGITYQWQQSTDSTTWADVSSATTTSLTTSQSAATYYRLKVTCANGGAISYTAGLKINLNPATACYCTPPTTSCASGDRIDTVRLTTLTNISLCSTNGYGDYTTTTGINIPNLARGNNFSVTVSPQVTTSNYTEYVGVWVDYNQNGSFEATEFVSFGSTVNNPLLGTISVPSTATLGNTRMRIRMRYSTVLTGADACLSYTYGETEDYLVNITNGTVPVTLLSFTGERKPAFNQLSWATASEQNNRGFELQRSADGVNFSAITFVTSKAANGYSNAAISYSFADAKMLAGNNYYRLKQVDFDGKATYSNIVLLKGDKVGVLTLSMVYPNPAKDKVNVIIASPKADKLTLIVSDVTGKIVRQQEVTAIAGDNNFEVNVQALSSGSYIIKAICNDGCETVISRFVKQ